MGTGSSGVKSCKSLSDSKAQDCFLFGDNSCSSRSTLNNGMDGSQYSSLEISPVQAPV